MMRGSVRARLLRLLCICSCVCVCVVGTAEEGQYDPCRIQGPTQEVLERSGSEIQDGQLENERGGKGTGVASFVNPGCFFSLDMCLLFTYAIEGGVSLKQVVDSYSRLDCIRLLSRQPFVPLLHCDCPLLFTAT